MSFYWSHYIDIATFLLAHTSEVNEEAALWSAISRAYYAAFCHAKYYARDQFGFVPNDTAEDHKELRKYFQSQGMAEIGRKLQQLRQWRNSCDYDDPSYEATPQHAKLAILQAENVIKKLG